MYLLAHHQEQQLHLLRRAGTGVQPRPHPEGSGSGHWGAEGRTRTFELGATSAPSLSPNQLSPAETELQIAALGFKPHSGTCQRMARASCSPKGAEQQHPCWADTQLWLGCGWAAGRLSSGRAPGRREERPQAELQGQKAGTPQVRLIRTIRGCQGPNENHHFPHRASAALLPSHAQKKGTSCF